MIDNENNTSDFLLKNSIFIIGKVFSVDGREIKIKVNKTKNSSHLLYKGELLKNVTVGSYIKIIKGFISVVAKVESEYIKEEKIFQDKYKRAIDKIDRILVVKLLGYFEKTKFIRGVKEIPLIDNECYLLDKDEFEKVHDFVKKGDQALKIGTLSFEKGQNINIGANNLFAGHIGIFGNTGSGKSYTLAKLYRVLFENFKNNKKFKNNAEFFFIDFNGEYIENDFGRNVIINEKEKNIYELSTREEDGKDKFPITNETINEHQFWSVILEATDKTQTPFINRSLGSKYLTDKLSSENGIKDILKKTIADIISKSTNVHEKDYVVNFLEEINKFNFHDIIPNINSIIDDYRNNLDFHSKNECCVYSTFSFTSTSYYSNQSFDVFCKNVIDDKIEQLKIDISNLSTIQSIRLKFIFNYYYEIINGYSKREHLAPLIGRLDKRIRDIEKVIKISDDDPLKKDKNFNIISLKNVNIQMRKVVPLLICKQLYEDKKRHDNKNEYLNIIIDEAHNILSYISERESEIWKDYRLETFEEIIKEGRKYGVFVTIASQRPYDISSTIISQLHNYFLHRLINNNDIEAINKTISYLDKVSFESLPILPIGTCVLAGIFAQVPVIVSIDEIEKEYEPNNKTINLIENWID